MDFDQDAETDMLLDAILDEFEVPEEDSEMLVPDPTPNPVPVESLEPKYDPPASPPESKYNPTPAEHQLAIASIGEGGMDDSGDVPESKYCPTPEERELERRCPDTEDLPERKYSSILQENLKAGSPVASHSTTSSLERNEAPRRTRLAEKVPQNEPPTKRPASSRKTVQPLLMNHARAGMMRQYSSKNPLVLFHPDDLLISRFLQYRLREYLKETGGDSLSDCLSSFAHFTASDLQSARKTMRALQRKLKELQKMDKFELEGNVKGFTANDLQNARKELKCLRSKIRCLDALMSREPGATYIVDMRAKAAAEARATAKQAQRTSGSSASRDASQDAAKDKQVNSLKNTPNQLRAANRGHRVNTKASPKQTELDNNSHTSNSSDSFHSSGPGSRVGRDSCIDASSEKDSAPKQVTNQTLMKAREKLQKLKTEPRVTLNKTRAQNVQSCITVDSKDTVSLNIAKRKFTEQNEHESRHASAKVLKLGNGAKHVTVLDADSFLGENKNQGQGTSPRRPPTHSSGCTGSHNQEDNSSPTTSKL